MDRAAKFQLFPLSFPAGSEKNKKEELGVNEKNKELSFWA